MNTAAHTIALMSAQALPVPQEGDGAPQWIHILPAGLVATGDKRGPYHVGNVQAIIDESFLHAEKLPVDINHAINIRAPKGEEAPAVGWITSMQARADGIWAEVEWTPRGARLVKSKEYRGISPVVRHTASKEIVGIDCVSLVNKPNLRGLTALHQQQEDTPSMDWMKFLADMLGLPETATEEDVKSALKAKMKGGQEVAAQSQLSEIGVALGLSADSTPDAILVAAQSAQAGGDSEETIVALQAELASVTTSLNSLTEDGKRDKAIAFVDGAIRAGHVGVKPQRDRYVSMHMSDPAGTAELIGALPILGKTSTSILPPAAKDGEVSLNAEQSSVAAMLGIDPKDYAATLKEEQAAMEASQ